MSPNATTSRLPAKPTIGPRGVRKSSTRSCAPRLVRFQNYLYVNASLALLKCWYHSVLDKFSWFFLPHKLCGLYIYIWGNIFCKLPSIIVLIYLYIFEHSRYRTSLSLKAQTNRKEISSMSSELIVQVTKRLTLTQCLKTTCQMDIAMFPYHDA